MILPKDFLDRMKTYLGDGFDEFLLSFDNEAVKSLRVNTLKTDKETVEKMLGTKLVATPFSPVSFYYDSDIKIGKTVAHAIGAVYSQEASASSAVTLLDPKPYDKVLDMCAAPGGKSTQIAAMLEGKGLLVSNEYVRNRANILLSNIERMGIKNAVVINSRPDMIEKTLPTFFDKILVDAPCSGEGMFRKDETAITEWSLEHVKACATRQLQIINSAANCLKVGGEMVYSTCTFSKEENEELIEKFLNENENFEVVTPNVNFGTKAFGMDAIRIYPKDGGEGHFIIKLIKKSGENKSIKNFDYKKSNKDGEEFYHSLFKDEVDNCIHQFGDRLIILPHDMPSFGKLSVIRAGVELGEIKKGRIEPSHSVFISQKPENCKNLLTLDFDSDDIHRYLKGEEIPSDTKSFTAVATESMVLGFGKASNGVLKNRYPKGLRFF